MVIKLDLRVLPVQRLGDDLPPQPRAGKNICLVNGVDFERGVGSEGNLCSDPGDAFDLGDAVDHCVPGLLGIGLGVLLLTGAKVGAPN